jgi:hypothetical protein
MGGYFVCQEVCSRVKLPIIVLGMYRIGQLFGQVYRREKTFEWSSGRPLLSLSFYIALRVNVCIPGMFRGPIMVIVINLRLKCCRPIQIKGRLTSGSTFQPRSPPENATFQPQLINIL